MDVPRLLVNARERARLTRGGLARRASTSTSALSAYERGVRSPTVATLDRLLASCGLQVRGELEPLLAHVDELVDALCAGVAAELPHGTDRLAQELQRAEVPHAFDGRTALVLHGLAAEPQHAEVAVPDTEALRRLFYRWGCVPIDARGRDMFTGWMSLDMSKVSAACMYSGFGFFSIRVVDALPPLLRIERDRVGYDVLTLADLEVAHPALADVLARMRQRRTVPS